MLPLIMKSKNIDEIFRLAIEPLKINPPDKVWSSLKSQLDIQREDKKLKNAAKFIKSSKNNK